MNIAIICDGKEISFGMNLSHLFKYITEDCCIKSNIAEKVDSELYSAVAFKHANISKKIKRIYVASALKIDRTYHEVYNNFGISIYKNEDGHYAVISDDKKLSAKEYDTFLEYANDLAIRYGTLEEKYFTEVKKRDPKWIVCDFDSSQSSGLFKKNNIKLQQQYDCAAFIFYLNYICKIFE